MTRKITKLAKSINVKWNEETYTVYKSEYQCPCCRVTYINTLNKSVTRFKCDCGQELIVK